MFDLMHRRADGSFVVLRGGYPYHVTADDPLFPDVAAAAEGVDLPPEPAPVVVEAAPALPTPLQWMDRIPPDRQAVLLDALDATPEGRRFQKRMLAAREIDTANPETQAGVAMLLGAGVLTEEEAAALLA